MLYWQAWLVMHDDCDNRGGACPTCRSGVTFWEWLPKVTAAGGW
jgi:hypothetical protein